MDLKGKVAIVTGGGTGMGKAISTLLAASGVSIAVNYSRSEADAVATAEELTKAGVEAKPIRADVSVASDVVAMIEQTERQLGRVDILVNNAGYTKFVPMNDPRGDARRRVGPNHGRQRQGDLVLQIVEDLQGAGRRVYLSVGRHRRMVRRYRGRDSSTWGYPAVMETTVDSLPSLEAKRRPGLLWTGVNGGHDIDLRRYASEGV